MPRVEVARMTRAGSWTCTAFIIAYFAVCLSQINHGMASLDAHGIIRVAQTLIENHKIDISRPPGHPMTEFYIFGALGWLLHLFGHAFTERVYVLGQAVTAAATLALFYELLRRMNVRSWPACLAVICLGLSAQFFVNAIDGEEFIYALFFVLLATRFLMAEPPRLFMSIFAFAIATGCRPEIIFAAVIYPIYFACARTDRRRIIFATAALALSITVVWLPILITGVHPPYDEKMNVKQALLVGGYKLIFQCFGIVIFVLLLVVLARACLHLRKRWAAAFPQNLFAAFACILPLLFFALFFRYPTKPAYVLVALPFLLIVATESRALLLGIAVLSAIELFIKTDIFKDRRLTAPFLTRGSGIAAIEQKPFYRLEYLRAAAEQCGKERTLVIVDAAPWDFEYQIRRGTLPAEEKRDAMQKIPAFIPHDAAGCVMLPRDAAYAHEMIENWRAHGYKMKMDAALYRTAIGRYDINRPNESTDFELFSVTR
jgi:hypothetical protein